MGGLYFTQANLRLYKSNFSRKFPMTTRKYVSNFYNHPPFTSRTAPVI